MKVILKADVKGSGKKGDVIEAADGYAKNYLLKKGLAEVATTVGINELTQKKAAEKFHKEEEIKAMKELAAALKGMTVDVGIKVGENGKVFGSVTSAQVAAALAAKGYEIDKKKIQMTAAKTLGTFEAEIRLMENISTKIKVNVVAL
jgi:large subunit ribosomal protein L9